METEVLKQHNTKLEKLNSQVTLDIRSLKADKIKLTNEKLLLDDKILQFTKDIDYWKRKVHSHSPHHNLHGNISESNDQFNVQDTEESDESIISKTLVEILVDVRHLLGLARRDSGNNTVALSTRNNNNNNNSIGHKSSVTVERINLLKKETHQLREVITEKLLVLADIRVEFDQCKTQLHTAISKIDSYEGNHIIMLFCCYYCLLLYIYKYIYRYALIRCKYSIK